MNIGGLVYDTHLNRYQCATIPPYDVRFFITVLRVLIQFERFLYSFRISRPSYLLVSHRVGLNGGTLSLIAKKYEVPIFSFGGDRNISLIVDQNPSAYEYEAKPEDKSHLKTFSDVDLDALFTSTKERHLNHEVIKDSKYAFSGQTWSDREEFAKAYNLLDPSLPFVFIMPHVFNDYPNSIYKNSTFADYFEWLKFTLKYIAQNRHINWVIREHPSTPFYNLRKNPILIASNRYASDNCTFIPYDAEFSTASLEFLADAVITCIGSIGFEGPALFNVPAIYFQPNPFIMFSPGLCLDSKEIYSSLLLNFNISEVRSHLNTRGAKECYVFMNKMSRFFLPYNPPFTQFDYIESEQDPFATMEALSEFRNANLVQIKKIEENVISQISLSNFERVRIEES